MKKYKILVLSDLDKSAKTTIKNAVSLAKMVGGSLTVFSVKKPTDIISKENQLSAMRTINKHCAQTDQKLKTIIEPIAEKYQIPINSSFAIGNVKNEISDFIENNKPDIIVLGKRKSAPFKLIGDGITKYVFNTFKGTIMVASNKNSLEPNNEISLGMLNNLEFSENLKFADELMAHSQTPLKSFKIVKKTEHLNEVLKPANQTTVEYVFEQGDSSVKSLSKYVNKNNIDVLYLNRMKKSAGDKMNLMKSDISNLINNLNVNLLVTSE